MGDSGAPESVSCNSNLKYYARATFVILSPPEADEESLDSLRLKKYESLRRVYPERSRRAQDDTNNYRFSGLTNILEMRIS